MTRDALLQTLHEQRRQLHNLQVDIYKTLSLLSVGCLHEQTSIYRWSWDSGYGEQRRKEGKICNICRRVDLYARGNWVDSKDIEV